MSISAAKFAYLPTWSMADYVDLYRRASQMRGVDIGPRLPGMLEAAGIAPADMNIVQPLGLRGEIKVVNALTMEAIAVAVVASGLARRGRTEAIIDDLYRLVQDETVLTSGPRIVQAWGRKPS